MKPGDPGSPEHALFHRLWSKAVDTPSYDKEEWMALEKVMQGRALAFVCYNCGVESKVPMKRKS